MRSWLIGVTVLVLCAGSAPAAIDSPMNPAGPHLGPVYTVQVRLSHGSKDVDDLNAAGFNISNVDGDVITINANAEELLKLRDARYAIIKVEAPTLPPQTTGEKALGVFHSYTDLTAILQTYAQDYGSGQVGHPDICRMYSLGQSVQGRELWALLITDNPDVDEEEPEVKYISTMHGNEPVGTELLLYLIDELLTQYGSTQRITDLVNGEAIWIVPLMNPDGMTNNTRYNANGVDLNRDFPMRTEITGNIYDGAPLQLTGRAIETQHVMTWVADRSFVLAANFHTGALLFNYLFDDGGVGSGNYAACADDTLVQALGLEYTVHNTPMYTNSSPFFANGIVDGSVWFEATGTMQDWNYRYAGCIEATVELYTTKWPSSSVLPTLWSQNGESMLSYLESVHRGVHGLVTASNNSSPLYAKVTVAGNTHPVFSKPSVGDYYRLLQPGTYSLTFSSLGYQNKTVNNVVVNAGAPTRVDASLDLVDADVNGDHVVDSADVQAVILAILGQPIPGTDCDVDNSGAVNSIDLQIVTTALLNK